MGPPRSMEHNSYHVSVKAQYTEDLRSAKQAETVTELTSDFLQGLCCGFQTLASIEEVRPRVLAL